MNPVVHFEMPYDNRDRMASFYEKAFGWGIKKMGPEMGNYVLASTTDIDTRSGMPKSPGAINGGFFERMKDMGTTVVISVDDIKEAMKRVTDSGGKIIGAHKPGEPDDIPGVWLYISFLDTEGNRVGMLQPTMSAAGAK